MNRFFTILGRALQHTLQWFFVTVPVWIWTNIFLAAILQGWGWFRGQVRRYAGWIILVSVVLLLAATGQRQLLNVVVTYAIAFALVYLGFRIMLRGLFPRNRRR